MLKAVVEVRSVSRKTWIVATLIAISCLGSHPRAAAPPPPAAGADASEIRFTVGESALLDLLRAATPQTVAVGNSLLSTDLTLLDPSDLVLHDGKASFRIRVKGRTLPVDQVVNPVISLNRDAATGQYYGVISTLPVQIQGLGAIDLKDYIPRFEIPAVLENQYRVSDRPLGIRLRIRRMAILEHQLEVGADIDLAPVVPSRAAGSG
jgi:hypothetical protein